MVRTRSVRQPMMAISAMTSPGMTICRYDNGGRHDLHHKAQRAITAGVSRRNSVARYGSEKGLTCTLPGKLAGACAILAGSNSSNADVERRLNCNDALLASPTACAVAATVLRQPS